MSPTDSHSRGQKRKLEQEDGRALLGVGQVISGLNGDKDSQETTTTPKDKDDSEGWQTVDRSAKRQKKDKQQNYPAVIHSPNARLQSFVKISDLQNLVLYLLADGNGPQWISVRHKKDIQRVVCLLVPGLEADMFNGLIPLDPAHEEEEAAASTAQEQDEAPKETVDGVAAGEPVRPSKPARKLKLSISPDDYYPTKLAAQKLPTSLEPFAGIFPHLWPIKTPGEYYRMHSPLNAMLQSTLPKPKEEKKTKGPRPPREGAKWQNVRTPITDFLASREELQDNGYAIHPAHLSTPDELEHEMARRHKACQSKEDGWIDLPDISSLEEGQVPSADIEQGSVTQGRKVLVVDCEMITTTTEKFALARVSLIDWDGKVVLDEFVKPLDPVKDYLTLYSGITKEMLDPVTQTLADVQAKLKEALTPQTILAGHSLDSDLRALRITYPFVIDTTLIYPHPKGPPQKSSLKWLTQKYLSREIQNRGPAGHDSIEDAKACLDLLKQKCEKGKTWGTSEATSESIFKRLGRPLDSDTPASDPGKTGAVVDWGDPKRGFGGTATVAIACENDADVVAGVQRAVLGPKTAEDIIKDENIPVQGCDFVWARLRELEALRGWWNRTKSADAAERLAKTLSNSDSQSDGALSTSDLNAAVARTTACIEQIYKSLPPKTCFLVYTGSGDPREMRRLSELQQEFKKAFQTMKWDELPVQWTDIEEQGLKKAALKARSGIGFVTVK